MLEMVRTALVAQLTPEAAVVVEAETSASARCPTLGVASFRRLVV